MDAIISVKPPCNLSATSRRSVADQSPFHQWSIADQSPNCRRSIAEHPPTDRRFVTQGCQISEPKCWWNPSATYRWLVGDWSATFRKLLQPVCDQNQLRLVYCAYSKDWLRLILFGHLSATSLRPLQNLTATSATSVRLPFFLVAPRSQALWDWDFRWIIASFLVGFVPPHLNFVCHLGIFVIFSIANFKNHLCLLPNAVGLACFHWSIHICLPILYSIKILFLCLKFSLVLFIHSLFMNNIYEQQRV